MAILCSMHRLMPVGFFMFLSMNDFTRLFICASEDIRGHEAPHHHHCLFAVVVM